MSEKAGAETSIFVRWCKFNFVGGIGIGVQFAALFFLRSILNFNYLLATAIAVEAAVVHNFVWHEQFTWSDRVDSSWRRSLPRLVRFNLTTGAVSILGNLALMKILVGEGHLNYLLANAIAIAVCSIANFLVSEEWVFADWGLTLRSSVAHQERSSCYSTDQADENPEKLIDKQGRSESVFCCLRAASKAPPYRRSESPMDR